MIDSCSKIEAGDWNEARKATWRLRMRVASRTKRFGKPSLNFLFFFISGDGGSGEGGREVGGERDRKRGMRKSERETAGGRQKKKKKNRGKNYYSRPVDLSELDAVARGLYDLVRELFGVL